MMKNVIPFLLLIFVSFTACSLFNKGDYDQAIPGKIVFAADDTNGNSQIFTMQADGLDLKQLTHLQNRFAAQPVWSPDGQCIAFASDSMGSTAGTALWLMDADGDNMRPVFRDPDQPWALLGGHPAWSPGGERLAYDHCINCEAYGKNFEILVIDLATDTVQRLTNHPAGDTNPTWSPDGNRIAFVSDQDYYDADTLRFRSDLYVMDVDGLNQGRLT